MSELYFAHETAKMREKALQFKPIGEYYRKNYKQVRVDARTIIFVK